MGVPKINDTMKKKRRVSRLPRAGIPAVPGALAPADLHGRPSINHGGRLPPNIRGS
jgi:hypothetical protein